MTAENDLAQQLQNMLNSANLTYDTRAAKIVATEWVLSRPAMIDKYLSRFNQDDERFDVLVAVRQKKASGSRYLQQKPHTNEIDYEIGMWLLVLDREESTHHAALREQVVNKIVDYFTNNPSVGKYRDVFPDDHISGRSYVLSNLITVTKTHRR